MEFGPLDVEAIQVCKMLLDQHIADLQRKIRRLDEEICISYSKLRECTLALANDLEKDPRLSIESPKQRRQRKLTRNLMTTSVVMTLTSISVAVSAKFGMTSKNVLPWSVAIGTGSFLCSCYLGKYVLDNFREYRYRPQVTVTWLEGVPHFQIQPFTRRQISQNPDAGACKRKSEVSEDNSALTEEINVETGCAGNNGFVLKHD